MKSADLCWGQRYIWLRHHHLPAHARHEAHIVLRFDMPAGVTLAMVRATLNYLVRRHEALRTTYHFDADRDPEQRVHPPAAVPVVQVTVERDGTATPAEVVEELSSTEFDLAVQWPIRACLITAGGAPKQLVLVLNHMAFDAWTVDRFEREFEALGAGLAARKPAVLEPIRHQPTDLARWESSAEALAAKEKALAYWRGEITELATDLFATRRGPGAEPAARGATLTSPSMLAACRRIADRHTVWPSLVHVAVYSMVMAAYTGSAEVAHLSFSGNREANPYADVMTCMFSPLLLRVDCGDNPPFSEVLRGAATRFRSAQDNAGVPYDELVELLSRESSRRGEAVRTGSELNFLNHGAHVSKARRTKFTWSPTPAAWAEYGADTFFRIYELQDAVVIALNALSTVMDADAVEKFLRGYESVLLALDEQGSDLRLDEIAAMIGFAPAAPTRMSEVETAATAAEAALALAAAVGQANGLGEVRLSDSYTVAGGRVLRIPRVLALLAEQGWTGITVHQLASGVALSKLAARLTAAVTTTI
ncbi:Condensation domain-containing protein [Actinokineospora alba]|uniref:Condensation domain-containing protein n=1 Tax=Actinokineospora alba TaxID=504798 RepID=A0A1H0QX59_9PSEU|nr:condensation domain-containing protein [Actinokineospora alba]TDP70352.1 condensation domain-containing protein [Actinokineospora alba]SDI33511.1 Condensation domain-containing protein [Actinokineospora alba]SDP21881.1 Condensation domain-containing protein [Actinokineospora alba]